MIGISPMSWQPVMATWALDWLNHEWSVLLGLSIDSSTTLTYLSTMNFYLTFCKIHHLPIDPTPDTLSLYITLQFNFISPTSVKSYLLGICNQIEPFYPEVCKHWGFMLVKCMLKEAWCVKNVAVERCARGWIPRLSEGMSLDKAGGKATLCGYATEQTTKRSSKDL